MSEQVRRIVTGHDAEGRAIIREDRPVPRVQRIGGEHGPLFFEVWNTRETPARIKAHFAEVAAADAPSHSGAGSRHAFMHRTETVDYGIMLEGELTLIMDVGETVIRPGDIVVQRGTNHGWANRSGKPCRIAFVLIDGTYESDLKP